MALLKAVLGVGGTTWLGAGEARAREIVAGGNLAAGWVALGAWACLMLGAVVVLAWRHLRMHRALAASERVHQADARRFQALVDRVAAGVIVHDAQGRVILSNPAAQRLLRLSHDEIVAWRVCAPDWRLVTEDGCAADSAELPVFRALRTRAPLRDVVLGVSIHGETVMWGLVNADPVFDANAELSQVVVSFVDITSLKLAQEALAAREREFRTLAENLPDNIVRMDAQGRALYINGELQRLLRRPVDGLLGRTAGQSHTGGLLVDIDAFSACVSHVLRTGEPCEGEFAIRGADGAQAQIHNLRFVPERDEHGRVVGVLSIGRDITRAKELEARLLDSEQKFRTLAENAPHLIIRYDRDVRRVYVNPAYERATGFLRAEVLGEGPFESWRSPSVSSGTWVDTLRRVMRTGEPEDIMIDWPAHEPADGGAASQHVVRIVAERDGDGHVVGALAMGVDITELKASERRLEASRAQLRELGALRERAREEERKAVAREIHDELGQVLTALKLGLSTARMQFGRADPVLDQRLQALRGLADRSIQVVRDVAYSLRPAALDLGIAAALDWLTGEFTRHSGVPVTLRVEPGLPTLDDEGAMTVFRIIQEGLTNTARHAAASRVAIELWCDAGSWRAEMSDDGRGFDPAAPGAHSFGLLGMRERVELLHGRLEIDSAPGRGTRLCVVLPCAAARSGALSNPPQQEFESS